jgi:osmotically-inducible protein OsmY
MKRATALAGLAACAALAGCAAAPFVGGGAILTHGVLQERSTLAGLDDTSIELGIEHRLGNRSGELYRDVTVDVTEGAVVLTGTVPRAEDRVAATEAAWATPGVVSVDDALEVRADSGAHAFLADVAISNRVRYELVAGLELGAVNYTVTTIDGTVHLTGLARSREELGRAIDLARQVEGVSRVVSHVRTIDDPERMKRLAAHSG